MRQLAIALSSALAAVLFSVAARAEEPPPPAPSAVPPAPPPYAPPPPYAAPPPAYGPPPYAPYPPYPPPAYYDTRPEPEPYDVRYPKKSAGIFISPLAVLGGTLGAELDLKLTSAVTMNVGGNYTTTSLRAFDRNDTLNAAAWAIDIGPQIFPFGRAFNQLYVYPRFAYARSWTTDSDPASGLPSATATAFGFATTVGYQWTYVSGFSFRLGAGFAYFSAQGSDDQSATQVRLAGLLPALDASLGWTF
jgi:hypothetical protein